MPEGGGSPSAFNLAEDVLPLSELPLLLRHVAWMEAEEYKYVGVGRADRFDAEQG